MVKQASSELLSKNISSFNTRAALFFAIALLQLILFAVGSENISAAILAVTTVALARYHKHCFPLLAFLLFTLPISLEPLATSYLDLSYYYLLEIESIPAIMLIQTVSLLPLLLIKPIESPAPIPLFRGDGFTAIAILICFFFVHFGINGGLAIGNYEAYRENLEAGSGLIEYALMAMVVLATLKKNKINSLLFLALVIFYCIKCALLGLRVQAIMGALLFSFLFLYSVSPRNFVIISILGGIIGLALGVLKHSLEFDAASLVLNAGYIQTPHSGSLTSASVAINHMNPTLIGAISTPLAMLIPRGLIGEFIPWAYPMSFIQITHPTPGGMLYGVYGYLNLGLLGPLIVGFMIAYVSTRLRAPRSRIQLASYYAALAFFVFAPRWVLYDFGAYGARTFVTVFVLIFLLLTLFRRRQAGRYINEHRPLPGSP